MAKTDAESAALRTLRTRLPRNLKIGRTAAHAIERLATELDAKLAIL